MVKEKKEKWWIGKAEWKTEWVKSVNMDVHIQIYPLVKVLNKPGRPSAGVSVGLSLIW